MNWVVIKKFYQGRKVGIDKQIYELTLNGNGVRAIVRILNIHRDTIASVLKKLQKQTIIF